MRTPHINLKELEKLKKENIKERLKFIEQYAKWVKKNNKWDEEQKGITD